MKLKWIKKLFEPPIDRIEEEIKELFDFLFDDYGFQYVKIDLGNLVNRKGEIVFYGPLDAYQVYNDNLCINIVRLVQRNDYDIYITEKHSNDQHYIFNGMHLPTRFAYDLSSFANHIKSELSIGNTIFGKTI